MFIHRSCWSMESKEYSREEIPHVRQVCDYIRLVSDYCVNEMR